MRSYSRLSTSLSTHSAEFLCLSQTARGEIRLVIKLTARLMKINSENSNVKRKISLLRRQPMILTWEWVVRVCVAVSRNCHCFDQVYLKNLTPRSQQSCLTLLYSRYSSPIVHEEALITTVLPIGKTTENRTWNILGGWKANHSYKCLFIKKHSLRNVCLLNNQIAVNAYL